VGVMGEVRGESCLGVSSRKKCLFGRVQLGEVCMVTGVDQSRFR
jgi:hypothetical protein